MCCCWMVGWLGLIGLLVDLDVLVVFTNAAACSSGCCFLISTAAAASGGLQPVKVVAPYGVSGVKLDNACPWLLYSCLSVIQENAPRTAHTMIPEGGFSVLFSRLGRLENASNFHARTLLSDRKFLPRGFY